MNKPYFIYIMDFGGTCLFSENLKNDFSLFEDTLFCGFINAIFKFSGELNKQIGYMEQKNIFSFPINENFQILILNRDFLLGVLVLEKKDIGKDMNFFLNEILDEFKDKYKDLLSKKSYDLSIFKTFTNEIERIYMRMQIFSFQIPKLKIPILDESKIEKNLSNLLKMIDGHRDINKLSKKINLPIDTVKTMISKLLWQDFITLSDKIYDTDIFEPKRDLFYLVRIKNLDFIGKKATIANSNEKQVEYDLLKSIDGYKTVKDLSIEFPNLTIHDIKSIISYYHSLNKYLEKVELFPRIIKIDEELRKDLSSNTLALSYSLENICDGEISITDIAERFDVPFGEIKRILDYFGKNVTYKKKYRV